MASLVNNDQPPAESEPGITDATVKSKRFRFKKDKHRHRHPSRGRDEGQDRGDSYKHHRHHHHRSKRRKVSPQPLDDPSAYDDSTSGLPPDVAFRESLFDAMGDDEGAAYWEGVYGHPIHTYPSTYQNEATGELEQMNDEEYAQFVRRKMWERSWEGIEAAKEEKRREREQEKQKVREEERFQARPERSKQETNFLFDLDIEKSLRRGARRKDRRQWKTLWADYLQRWAELQALHESHGTSTDGEQLFLRNKIAWPIESGKRKDVNVEEVERFLRNCTEAIDSDTAEYTSILKSERVRWHPDKIQQRYGFMDIDNGTMQGVTAVFQIFDRMWNDSRSKG